MNHLTHHNCDKPPPFTIIVINHLTHHNCDEPPPFTIIVINHLTHHNCDKPLTHHDCDKPHLGRVESARTGGTQTTRARVGDTTATIRRLHCHDGLRSILTTPGVCVGHTWRLQEIDSLDRVDFS